MATLLTGLVPGRQACFERWPSGGLYLATGLGPVKKWNGKRADFTTVGVEAPSAAATVGGSGSGSITGTYYALVRFLDEDGVPGPPSPLSGSYAAASKGSIDYSSVPVPVDMAKCVRKQVLRNTDGQSAVFYVDVDTTDVSDTTLSSSNTDAQLKLLGPDQVIALYDQEGNDLTASWGAPRDDKPLLARHRGRLFAAGSAEYAEGMAQVTNASTSVKGIGTAWTTNLAGRFFEAAGYSVEIASVNATTQTITLASAWAGSTSKFQLYAVRPDFYGRSTFFYSEADNPEGWDPSCGLALTEAADQVKAMIDATSYLWLASETQLFKFAFDADPYLDGQCHPVVYRGCVNQRCWVRVEGSFFCLDRLGVYRLDGDQATEVAESIRDLWVGEAAGEFKIDWTLEDSFHAVHDAQKHMVRFFVSLSGPMKPRHALCYDYAQGAWWIEEYPWDATASVILSGPDRRTVLLGPGLAMKQLGPSHGDGADLSGQPVVAAVSAATHLSVTCPALAGLSVSNLPGTPLAITDGRGAGQERLIVSQSGSRFDVDRPWSVLPDATSRVLVGAVAFRLKTGKHGRSMGESDRAVTLDMEAMTDVPAGVRLTYSLDDQVQEIVMGNTLDADMDAVTSVAPTPGVPGEGHSFRIRPDRNRGIAWLTLQSRRDQYSRSGDHFQAELFGHCGREPLRIARLDFEGVEP